MNICVKSYVFLIAHCNVILFKFESSELNYCSETWENSHKSEIGVCLQ